MGHTGAEAGEGRLIAGREACTLLLAVIVAQTGVIVDAVFIEAAAQAAPLTVAIGAALQVECGIARMAGVEGHRDAQAELPVVAAATTGCAQ